MTQVIEQIIRLNVEFEGVLRVAAARPSAEALTAAAEKLEQINSLFSELKAPEAQEASSEHSENSEHSEISEADTEPAAAAAEPIAAVEAIEAVETPVFRDIRKNLTINDKFLFKRELFNGSNEEFNDTLDLISTMHSLAEAEEYLYEDMALDPDNDTVKDFIALVTNYFNQK